MIEPVTLGQLMQLVLRLEADVRAFAEAVEAYDGWRGIPGDSPGFCADTADNIGFELTLLRTVLRDEHRATQAAEQPAQPEQSGLWEAQP